MGMPISNYTMLHALATRSGIINHSSINQALEQFNLFAIVIHDPTNDIGFHLYVEEWFERLDFSTGNKLLFFALVLPKTGWMKSFQNRDYFRYLHKWNATDLVIGDATPKIEDTQLSAYTFASTLEIPLDELPCIVVTNDLNANAFFHIPTSREFFIEQLNELGYLASQMNKGGSLKVIQHEMRLKFPSVVHEHHYHELTYHLAEALTNVLSFLVIGDSSSVYEVRSTALNQIRVALKKLYQNLQEIRLSINESTEEFDKLALTILNFLSLINNREIENIIDPIPLDKALLEQETQIILRTAYRVYDLLHNDPLIEQDRLLGSIEDWSPCLIGFSKVFEKEINCSIVQWLRFEKGIEMPDYFLKLKPGYRASIDRADLNRGIRGEWIAPGCGQSEMAFTTITQEKYPPNWDSTHIEYLIDHWRIISNSRNSAAHDRLVNETELNKMINSLRDLAINKYFDLFYRLKTDLR
jgi:hypothetical protein